VLDRGETRHVGADLADHHQRGSYVNAIDVRQIHVAGLQPIAQLVQISGEALERPNRLVIAVAATGVDPLLSAGEAAALQPALACIRFSAARTLPGRGGENPLR
jgi:hypothetical protein